MQLILKRLMACVYELLILLALWMLLTWLFVSAFGDATHGLKHLLLQALLWLMTGLYFVVCWVKTGQTLAMQAWKMKVVGSDGQLLTLQQASVRYLLACLLTMAFGIGLLYMLFNQKRLFLHDRILHTQFVLLNK
ncbi:RDD family protein [Methylotenera sp. N17]|uniref:RDD family protein n=1 Tax=Methylotenera sp. N17 TaxID=1502761 RepID=UPI00064926FF|nr:RDD family protein [Methylotenera sp. N17]